MMNLCTVLIDLTETFNMVNRGALWFVLLKLGYLWKFILVIGLFHDNINVHFFSSREHSNTFTISNEVMQGYVMTPDLFNFFFSQILAHAMKDIDLKIYIRYYLGRSHFRLCRLSVWTKTMQKFIVDLLFANDCAIIAHKKNYLHVITNYFTDVARQFRHLISIGKTDILFQQSSNTLRPSTAIKIEKAQLKCVDSSKYLGRTISADRLLDRKLKIQPSTQQAQS